MTNLEGFTASLAGLPEVDATVERWVYGTIELERKMSERIISLCRYFDRIPEDSLSGYLEVLFDALDDGNIESGFLKSEHLNRSMKDFIDHVRGLEDPAKTRKVEEIFDKVRDRFQLNQ